MADLAPTIAQEFGAPTTVFLYGRALETRPVRWPLHNAIQTEATANNQRAAMRLLPAAAVVLGILLAATTATTLRVPRYRAIWLFFPVAMQMLLIVPSVPGAVGIAALITPIIIGCARKWGQGKLLFAICSLTAMTSATSFMNGSALMHHSLVGYSVIEGARYYGIGNETMGLLFGSALTAAFLVSRRVGAKSLVPLAIAFTSIVMLLGIPSAGAKVGGVLVSVGTFGVYLLLLSGRRVGIKELTSIAAVTIAVLGMLIVLEHHLGRSGATHLGQLWDNTQNGESSGLIDTILRKAKVELRLAYHSCWALALAGGLFAVRMAFRKSGDRARTAFRGASIAAIVLTLLLNDAGVVACSLMLPFLAAGLSL
jgi:hypothetical protein